MFQKLPYYIWIVSLVFMIAFGVMYLDHFRMYRSQVDILIIHKNEKTAGSADQVVSNIIEIPKTLSFYNRLLKQFPEIHDAWSGMSDEDRQEEWNKYIQVDRVDTSGIIRLQVSASSKEDASILVEKSKQNLFQVIGQYYDIRNELDIRAVDGPITHVVLYSPMGWLVATLVSGVIATLILIGVVQLILQKKDVFSYRKSSSSALNAMQKNENQKRAESFASSPVPVTFPLKGIAKDTPIQSTETVVSSKIKQEEKIARKHSAAQGNLPFLEEGISLEQYLFGHQEESREQEEVSDIFDDAERKAVAQKPDIQHIAEQEDKENADVSDETTPTYPAEPTKEELKRRLNQLLRGEEIR